MFIKVKALVCAAATAAGIAAVSLPVCAASSEGTASSKAAPSSQSASSAASQPANSTKCPDGCHDRCRHHGTMELLAQVSGKSLTDLEKAYPQKTAWQAAKEMGRLADLKTAYLARAKSRLDKLVADRKISADDSAKIYMDLKTRVSAIDGVNIVITGRPSFHPQFEKKGQ